MQQEKSGKKDRPDLLRMGRSGPLAGNATRMVQKVGRDKKADKGRQGPHNL
jgi:hypothetical protein